MTRVYSTNAVGQLLCMIRYVTENEAVHYSLQGIPLMLSFQYLEMSGAS